MDNEVSDRKLFFEIKRTKLQFYFDRKWLLKTNVSPFIGMCRCHF